MQRRYIDFRTCDEVSVEIDRLKADGFAPAGNWSLAQICAHLAKSMEESLDGYTATVSLPIRILVRCGAGRLILRRILKKRRMPNNIKGPAAMMPTDTADEFAAVARIREALGRTQAAASFHPSPIFGKVAAEQMRQIHLIHAAHHLGFLIPRESQQPAPQSA